MPGRRKTYPKIFAGHLSKIERQALLLEIEIRQATLPMTTFSDHWNALSDLQDAIKRTLNILNGRDPNHSNMISVAQSQRLKDSE